MKQKSEKKMPPKRIWLQFHQEDEEAKTWCQDKINDDDVEYVLSSHDRELVERLGKKKKPSLVEDTIYASNAKRGYNSALNDILYILTDAQKEIKNLCLIPAKPRE